MKWRGAVDAFGQMVSTASAINSPLRFAGQYYDSETSMHYNYFRDYDPEIGRYIQSDPIGLEGGVNRFSYANQNPNSNQDPEGLAVFSGTAAAIVWAAARASAYICSRNPKKCRALLKCIKNKKKCKDSFCKKKPNRTYHGEDGKSGVCNIPKCTSSDGTATAIFKKAAAEMCVAMREFVAYACHNGKFDKAHKRELDEAKEKVKSCRIPTTFHSTSTAGSPSEVAFSPT